MSQQTSPRSTNIAVDLAKVSDVLNEVVDAVNGATEDIYYLEAKVHSLDDVTAPRSPSPAPLRPGPAPQLVLQQLRVPSVKRPRSSIASQTTLTTANASALPPIPPPAQNTTQTRAGRFFIEQSLPYHTTSDPF
jgi:hypothetical protein